MLCVQEKKGKSLASLWGKPATSGVGLTDNEEDGGGRGMMMECRTELQGLKTKRTEEEKPTLPNQSLRFSLCGRGFPITESKMVSDQMQLQSKPASAAAAD